MIPSRLLTFICLLVYIPHTSIQDVSIDREILRSRRTLSTDNVESIENFIRWLTEQQHQYETASYALKLNNVLPNVARYFHEQSEKKQDDVRNLIDLCQLLNIELNLKSISSNAVSSPLQLLAPRRINQTNILQYFSDLKLAECQTTLTHFNEVYRQNFDKIVPFQMYLKKKFLFQQSFLCKITSDLHTQLHRFLQITTNINDRSIPFSFRFLDSTAKILLEE